MILHIVLWTLAFFFGQSPDLWRTCAYVRPVKRTAGSRVYYEHNEKQEHLPPETKFQQPARQTHQTFANFSNTAVMIQKFHLHVLSEAQC